MLKWLQQVWANASVAHRILAGIVILLVIGVAAIETFFLDRFQATLAKAESRELHALHNEVVSLIGGLGKEAEAMAVLVAENPQVQRAMAEGDREALAAMYVPGYERLRNEYRVGQFQFHVPPATSFLRVHKPAKFGDDLSGFRKTVLKTNETRRPLHGIESGKYGLGVRGLSPVIHEGRHVGSVEFGLAFGQDFLEAYKERTGADVAVHLREGSEFKTFASTHGEKALLDATTLSQSLNGQSALLETHLNERPTAVYAAALKDFSGEPIAVLEVAMDRSYYAQAISSSRNAGMMIGAAVLLLGVLLAFLLSRGIVRPLRDAVVAMNDIAAGEGDLTRRLEARGRNEIAELAEAFNRFADKVQAVVRDVAASASKVSVASGQMAAVTQESNEGVARQRGEVDQVATAMNEMTATVQEVARNASEAAKSAETADKQSQEGREIVEGAVHAIEALAGEVERAAGVIQKLEQDSDDISAVLDVIRGVAEQTNLLALNAAIEAARAGEQGRGFAVVADEVRTLASRTQESTGEIQQVIERLQAGARDAVGVMQNSQTRAQRSVSSAKEADHALEKILASVGHITDMNNQIASAAEEQSTVSEEINKNVVNISQAAADVTAGAEQAAQASGELAGLAQDLERLVGQFKYQ